MAQIQVRAMPPSGHKREPFYDSDPVVHRNGAVPLQAVGDADCGGGPLRADLHGTDLRGAKLGEADLGGADLSGTETDLYGADLHEANLHGANLSGADLTGAILLETVFADVDLRTTKGLDACTHGGPCIIDHRTLQRSGLPLAFLQGCGLPDGMIDQLPSLLKEAKHYSCFISHSPKDKTFANRLWADLQNKGIRCWFAPHDLSIGSKTLDAIDEAIKGRDKLLLILSKNSIESDWVEDEVLKAYAEERRRSRLCYFRSRSTRP